MEKQLLNKIDLFYGLDDKLLEEISKLIIRKSYAKNEIIFREGEPGEATFFVYSGKVKATKLFPNGEEIIICTLGPEDVFAEVTLLKKDQNYPVTATALEKSQIGMIKNKDLEHLLRKNPDFAVEMIRKLNDKLLDAHYRISNMGMSDIFKRTLTIIKKLSDSFGVKTAEGIKIEAALSRQDIANIVGTSRETVSRTISKLKNEGIIDTKGQNIILKNPDALEEYL